MTYELYMNQPVPYIELRKNLLIARNPQLLNSLHRNKNHPLIGNIHIYHTTSIINSIFIKVNEYYKCY